MALLLADGVYKQGHGVKGSLSWSPVATIQDALQEGFYKAFVNVVPTGKAIYIGLDISGSMGSEFTPGSGITCAQAGAALCLVTAKTEENYCIYGFASPGNGRSGYGGRWGGGDPVMVDLGITKSDTLESAIAKAGAHTMGGTDCSLPVRDAAARGLEVDAFLTITDNETWAGELKYQTPK
jgi:60 kDa SS-A/Ro ribonucleoprotein